MKEDGGKAEPTEQADYRDDQDMEGSVIWDTISQLDFYMTDGRQPDRSYSIDDESFAGNGGDGYCNVYVSDDSTWTVTGDSTVSKAPNAGTIVDNFTESITLKGTNEKPSCQRRQRLYDHCR